MHGARVFYFFCFCSFLLDAIRASWWREEKQLKGILELIPPAVHSGLREHGSTPAMNWSWVCPALLFQNGSSIRNFCAYVIGVGELARLLHFLPSLQPWWQEHAWLHHLHADFTNKEIFETAAVHQSVRSQVSLKSAGSPILPICSVPRLFITCNSMLFDSRPVLVPGSCQFPVPS